MTLEGLQFNMQRAGLAAAREKYPTLCGSMSDEELWGVVATAVEAANRTAVSMHPTTQEPD